MKSKNKPAQTKAEAATKEAIHFAKIGGFK